LLVATAFGQSASAQDAAATPDAPLAGDSASSSSVAAPPKQESPEAVSVLPAIVITGERNRDRVGKTIVSGEQLRQVAGSSGDPMKAVQSLPGIAVADDSSGAPAIRGSRPEDNAYYIDGIPAGYLFHAGGLVSVIHGNLVQDFDLYSAAFGPQYGDVTGATLDVALRNPRTDRLGGIFNISLLGSDLLVEGPVAKDQSFYFAARRSWIDLLLKDMKDTDSGVTVEIPRYWDYQGKYLWRLNDSNALTLHLNGATDHLGYTVPGDSVVATQDPILSGTSTMDTSYGAQAVVLDSDFSIDAGNTLAIGHTRNRDRTIAGAAGRYTTDANTTFLREQLRFKPAERHELLIGGDYSSLKADIDLNISSPLCTEFDPQCDYTSASRRQLVTTLRVNSWDTFIKDRWQVLPQLTLIGGARYSTEDYLQRSHTEPRVGAEWTYSERTLVTAGWGKYNQFPAGEQVAPTIGNSGLRHIRAEHSSLGLSRKLDDGWSWKVEGYYKKFYDLIVSDPDLNYVNGASGSARGIELLIRKNATDRFSGWFSLSLSDSRRRNDVTGASFPFAFDQPVIANLVGNYRISDNWLLGAKWSYHSGNLDTPIIGVGTYSDGRARPIYGATNSERLPAYHRLDVRLDRKFSPAVSTYIEVINAYGRKNVAGYQYNADYSSRTPVHQLPWLASVGVEVKF
jgi:hypothetical protein